MTQIALRTYDMTKKNLNVRITHEEQQILDDHAAMTGRTKTEIVRAFIRSLRGEK